MLLALILLAGLSVRVLYLRENVAAPDFAHPDVDALTHDYWARGLATGNWSPPEGFADPHIQETPFFRPPGYPYFLALIYRLSGGSYLAPRIVQMLLGLVSGLLVFLIGRRWFGTAVGLLASAANVLYWAFVYFEGELHAPALLNVLLLGCIDRLGRWSESKRPALLGAGAVLLGLAALVRPNVLAFAPVVAVWSFVLARRGTATRRSWFAPLAVLGIVVLTIAPATLRNVLVADDFVLISSNGGINLYIGNSASANGSCPDEIPGFGRFGTCFDYPGIVAALERRLGRSLRDSEVSDWFKNEALRFIRENPAAVSRLLMRKFLLFWGPAEVGHNKEVQLEREHSPVLRILPGNFTLAAALGLVGGVLLVLVHRREDAAVLPRKQRASPEQGSAPRRLPIGQGAVSLLMALLILVLSFSILPFFVAGRYRVPIVPFLLIFAAYALLRIGRALLARRTAFAVAVLAAAVLVTLGFYFLPQNYTPNPSRWHYLRGVAQLAAHQPELAEAEFCAALEVEPRNVHAHYNLGVILADQGKLDAAMVHWQRAVELRPDLPEPHNNLGAALLLSGEFAGARKHFQAAVELQPRSALYRVHLAQALMRLGETVDAEIQLQEALRLAPEDASIHKQMATALQERGRIAEAVVHFKRALQLQEDPVLANNLAWLLATHQDAAQRDGKEALRLAEQVCAWSDHKNASYLDTLAAAYAENGNFEDATRTIRRAIQLARAAAREEAVERMNARLRLYEAGQPYRDPALGP